MEAEIVPQVFHLHLHELLPLEGRGPESLAEEAEAGPVAHLARAGHAEILLAIQAGLLLRATGIGQHVRLGEQDGIGRATRAPTLSRHFPPLLR